MTAEVVSTAQGIVLFDSERIAARDRTDPASWFDADAWAARNQIVARSSAGRGGVLFIRNERYYWALRHYRRGGLPGKLIADSYLWLGESRTRSFAEWRLLHTLRAQGLPVPVPVAARYKRHGLWYRADLMTEALPAVRTLADTITGARLLEEVWKKIGSTIAKFHRAGVQHADLNAHNVLLGESASVWLLDFDRGRIRARGTWEQDVLARLKRSLAKIQHQRTHVQYTERDWLALMDGYDKTINQS